MTTRRKIAFVILAACIALSCLIVLATQRLELSKSTLDSIQASTRATVYWGENRQSSCGELTTNELLILKKALRNVSVRAFSPRVSKSLLHICLEDDRGDTVWLDVVGIGSGTAYAPGCVLEGEQLYDITLSISDRVRAGQ